MKLLAVIALTVLLMACQAAVRQPQESAPITPAQQGNLSSPAKQANTKPSKASLIKKLLQQGDLALQQNRLTTPIEDNAYDRFTAVLLLEPDNQEAKTGLEEIAFTYVNLVQDWIARGKLSSAKQMLRRFQTYFPDHPMLEPTTAALVEREKQLVEHSPRASQANEGEILRLDADALNRRSDVVKETLQEVAERLQESDESIWIYARNDAEGRWIYQVMKDHVQGYRIRGDIRISKRPAIKFMDPL